jgi:hypothetical protein
MRVVIGSSDFMKAILLDILMKLTENLILYSITTLMHSVLKCTVRNLDDGISTMLYGNGPS